VSADWTTMQKAMQDFVVAATGLLDTQVVWGQQDARRPPGPAISMRISNIAEVGKAELNIDDNPLTFSAKTVTLVDVAGNRFEIIGHGLLTGDGPVQIDSSLDDLPAPLAEQTDYWVIAPDANHIQFARSYADTGGGQGAGNPTTPITLTDAGSGTTIVTSTPDTLRAGQEVNAVARTLLRVTLELRCHSADAVGPSMATSILNRVKTRRRLPTVKQWLDDVMISVSDVDRVRAILGIRDALLFEPRAYLDVHLMVPVEESEALTIIQIVEITNQTTGNITVVDGTVPAPLGPFSSGFSSGFGG
jgi:hypothetical protein